MSFVGFVSIMLILHAYEFFFFFHYSMFVLWCAYHVHDKMPLRCFCVLLWIPWNTKFVGIIMFL